MHIPLIQTPPPATQQFDESLNDGKDPIEDVVMHTVYNVLSILAKRSIAKWMLQEVEASGENQISSKVLRKYTEFSKWNNDENLVGAFRL